MVHEINSEVVQIDWGSVFTASTILLYVNEFIFASGKQKLIVEWMLGVQ